MKTLVAAVLLAMATPIFAQASRPATPGQWRLVEQSRIGSDAAEFAEIRGIVATPAGRTFVLDYKLHEINMFDAKGKFLRKVAGDGEGPGEIRDANGLAIGPDGNVWVNDPANGRFSIFSPDGEFVRQLTIPITGFGYLWEGVVDGSGRAIDPISKLDPITKKWVAGFVRMINPTGKADTMSVSYCPGPPQPASPVFSFRNERGGVMTGVPYVPRSQIVMTVKGTIWCTPSHEYRLSVGRIGQPLKEVVVRKVAPLPVSAAERRGHIQRIDSLTKIFGKPERGSVSDIPKTKPIISRIIADAEGNVWVRRTDALEAKPTYDVYNDTGTLLAVVQSPGPVGHQVFVSGSTFLTVIMDEDDMPTVVRYAVQRVQGRR